MMPLALGCTSDAGSGGLSRALHVPAGELYALTMRVATNRGDDQAVAAYFRSRAEAAG